VSSSDGIPASGAYVGAAVGGTANLADLESGTGRLAIHRLYFEADQVDYAITAVKQDLAAGRLPWISFKLPYSWADMAAGAGDAWATDLAERLAEVGGPVWLAFHHEPEGDGPIQDWTRMQQRLAPIVHAHAPNVAYTVILTAWDSLFGPAEYRLGAVWPGDGDVDILGADVYNEYGAKAGKASMNPMDYFGPLSAFARRHGVRWAIAETGYTAAAATADAGWLQRAFSDLRSTGGIAFTYFDSSLNSIADWTLDDSVRRRAFDEVLARSVRLC